MTELKTFLTKLHACNEAIEWVGERDLKTAWEECERADWMLWLCGNMIGKKNWPAPLELVLSACDCAEYVLPIWEKGHPDDHRPRLAIEIALKLAGGNASLDEMQAARDAAWAAGDASGDASGDAARAVAWAAMSAAWAAMATARAVAWAAMAAAWAARAAAGDDRDAALAVAWAARAAAGAAARNGKQKEIAALVRKRLTIPHEFGCDSSSS